MQAGPFTMGSNSGYDDEKPEHTCDVIKRDYAIGMFPVTNAEYDCFVKAGGYDNKDYWTPARLGVAHARHLNCAAAGLDLLESQLV